VSRTSGLTNVHAAWRLEVARAAAAAYAPNQRLAAMAAAGSVGSGLADRYSDLELDCYWHEPPADRDRLDPVERLGGQVEAFWEFDSDEEEWSEDYRLGPLHVTISNFTVATVERFLDLVTRQADTDPARHMRLAAIQRCRPLAGLELLAAWRERANRYPDELVAAMVQKSLAPDALGGWAVRAALVSRGDEIAVHTLLVAVQQAVLGTVLAVNRVYAPHRLAKWQRHLLSELTVTPDHLASRLHALTRPADLAVALSQAEALLTDTARLAEAAAGIALTEFRELLAERRPAIDPPAPAAPPAPPNPPPGSHGGAGLVTGP
jgi:hypothetical protein